MKKQEFEELKQLTIKELEQKRLELVKRLFEQRTQVKFGQIKNTRVLRNLRKDVARINTLIQQKRLSNIRGGNG
ncbi:MAG: 50S ribosomal protein L29 [bacterium]|nr:50S ribosomal protein L29 [bacterium]